MIYIIIFYLLLLYFVSSFPRMTISFIKQCHKLLDFIKIKTTKKYMILPFINTYFAFNEIYELYTHTLYDITIITKYNTVIKHCTLYLNSNEVLIYKVFCAERINNNDIAYIIFHSESVNKRIKDNIDFLKNINIP